MYTHLLTVLKLINDIEKKQNSKIKNIRVFNKDFKKKRFKVEKKELQKLKENIKKK